MKQPSERKIPASTRRLRAGFTVPELVIASALGLLVSAGVLTVFLWTGEQAALCSKISSSQDEAMRTMEKVTDLLHNGSSVAGIDVSSGRWVQVRFPDTTVSCLTYSNDVTGLRNGALYLQETNTTQLLVARGLTSVMDSRGFTTPMFTQTRSNSLRIAFRVATPTQYGTGAANDSQYAASVNFAVTLRNAPQTQN